MSEDIGNPREEDQFSEFLNVLRRRKGIVVGGVVLFLLLGGLMIALSSPSYQVVARVLIQSYSDRQYNPATNAIDKTSQIGVAPEIGSQMSLIQSPSVLQQAFTQANVNLPSDLESTERILSVQQENTTPVLDIEVNLPDPDSASRLAQAIPAAYNEFMQRTNEAKANEARALLQGKVTTARSELNKAQRELETFLSAQGNAPVAANGAEGAARTERLSTFNQQLELARVSLSSAESALQESLAAQAKVPKEIREPNQRPPTEAILAQQRTIGEIKSQLQAARATLTDGSPEVKSLVARLKQEEANLRAIPTTINQDARIRNPERAIYDQRVAEARQRVASARSEVDKLQTIVASETAALDAYQKRLPHQRELESTLEEKRVALAAASQSLAEVNLIGASNQPAVQVVSVTSPLKTQPAIGRTLIASTLLGIVFGVLAALIRDRFDNRVHTLEQIYDASGAMPIGSVPVTGKLLALESGQGRNRTLESYRSLRFNLETAAPAGGAVQSVLVASASAGEGRAALSSNLAIEAATDLRKTILVDGDLRTPELHDRMKLARSPGLSDVLAGTISLQDALQKTSQDNLLFLASGTEHHNPLELLSGSSMEATHEALKEMADVVVINSPSLMRFSDGRAIARVADSVIFVAKRGFTRRDAMRYCVGMLRRTTASILGVVLVDERGRTSDVPYFATE